MSWVRLKRADSCADLIENFVKRAKMTRPVRPKALRKRSIVEESRSGLVRKPKTETLFCTIPDLVDRAQEAEDPRLVYSHLKDLEKFPRKTLKFEEDLRPPYSGELGVVFHAEVSDTALQELGPNRPGLSDLARRSHSIPT
jgi:hypothetical protein